MTAYRYPLPRAYRRPRYPFRYGKAGDQGSLKTAGIAAAVVVALGTGGGTAVTVTHRKAPPARHSGPATAAARPGMPVTSAGESAFTRAVLADMGAPATSANIRSLEAWYPHEYPSWPPRASSNPMNSTLYAPGSTAYNTLPGGIHVWNYPSASVGAEQTAKTLGNGNYPSIVAALRSGNGVCGAAPAEFLTWSGGGYSGVC